MKICNKCKKQKLYSDFWKDKNKKDGYKTICISCDSKNKKQRKRKRETDKLRWRELKKNNDIEITKNNFRRRLRLACKNGKTEKLIGCSWDFLFAYLQITAIKNGYLDFNIHNYSGKEYHIDHIIPCSIFNLKCSFHQKLCNNWTNLQILKAKDNIRKGNNFTIDK